jgi:hypothetical protein
MWGHKGEEQRNRLWALALGNGKGQSEGEKKKRGIGDKPAPSLAGRVLRSSGMLGMGLLP